MARRASLRAECDRCGALASWLWGGGEYMTTTARRVLHGVAEHEGWALSWKGTAARCPSCRRLPLPPPPPMRQTSDASLARPQIDAEPPKTSIRTSDPRADVVNALRAAQAALVKSGNNIVTDRWRAAVLRRLIEGAVDIEREAEVPVCPGSPDPADQASATPADRDRTEEDRQP